MEVVYSKTLDSFTVTYELTEKEVEAIKEMKEKRYLEFKLCRSADSFDMDTWYEGVNTKISYELVEALTKNRFSFEDFNFWNTRYRISELGEKYLEVMEG